MIVYDFEQGTPEWHAVRAFRLTASHAQAIAAAGKGLETYVRSKIQDLIAPDENYTNSDMERGNELEEAARQKYSFEKEVEVYTVGFIAGCEHSGCSPDGLVGIDGGIEIKARNNKIHLGYLLGDPVPTEAVWQIQMSLLITGRQWWDYVSYNPNFYNSLYVKRIYPDVSAYVKIEKGLEVGIKQLKSFLENEMLKSEFR